MSMSGLISFTTNYLLVGHVRGWVSSDCRGLGEPEVRLVVLSLVVMMICSALESAISSYVSYILICLVPITVARCIMDASLEGLFSVYVPCEHSGKARSALGVAMSAVGVFAPTYGAFAFTSITWLARHLAPDRSGDELRIQWKGVLTAAHYASFAMLVQLLLRGRAVRTAEANEIKSKTE